jgi:hypothetical protein
LLKSKTRGIRTKAAVEMNISPKVKVQAGIFCKPIVCLLNNEIIVRRDKSAIDLKRVNQIRLEGVGVIAIIFQITENTLIQEGIKPIGRYLEEIPQELGEISLLTTQWNHIRAIVVHQEMQDQDLKDLCNAYYETITEVSFDTQFTKGWIMSTLTAAELSQIPKAS